MGIYSRQEEELLNKQLAKPAVAPQRIMPGGSGFTPREEVMLNQLTQSKPSQPSKPAAPAAKPAPVQAPSAGGYKPTNPEVLKQRIAPFKAPTPLTPVQQGDATLQAKFAADTQKAAMYNKQIDLENSQGRQTGYGAMVRPRIGGNGRDQVAMSARAMPAKTAAPPVASPVAVPTATPQAQQAPGTGVLLPNNAAQPAPVAQAVAPQLQPGDRNTFTGSDKVTRKVTWDNAGNVTSGGQGGPTSPDWGQSRRGLPQPQNIPGYQSPNIAGGMSRADIIAKMESITGDSRYAGSPIARKAMFDTYQSQLAAMDQAELNRAGGQQTQQNTAIAGQNQYANTALQGQNDLGLEGARANSASNLESQRQNAPQTIVDENGITRIINGTSAATVLDEAGKPVKQQQARSLPQATQDRTRFDALKAMSESFDPDVQKEGIDGLRALAAGDGQAPANSSPAPDFATWAAAAQKQYPKATPEQIKAGYESLYNTGAK